jgi:hypothetical protein
MKHPTPSDFLIEVTEVRVNVTFKLNGRSHCFGRLTDPEDIARYGPLSRGVEGHVPMIPGSTPRPRSRGWRMRGRESSNDPLAQDCGASLCGARTDHAVAAFSA